MGCDIHVMVEAKTASGWHSVHMPKIDRFYRLFARMADVRNYDGDEPVDSPRGVPSDCAETTRIYMSDTDYHSHSWLSSDEWEGVYSHEKFGGPYGELSDVVPWEISDKGCRDKRFLDYRLVFAFDN